MAQPALLQPRQRRGFLGASEVATALGLIPDSDVFARPIDIWLEKTGAERVTPVHRGRTEAGKRFEPVVAAWYQDLTGVPMATRGTLVHPEHNWIGATPDYVREDAINVQIKTVGARGSFSWPGINSIGDDDTLILNPPDGIPDYYRVQVEWEMAVLGVEMTHLVALLGGTDLRVYEVPRDLDLWLALYENARRFWFEHVLADIPPPPDGSEAFKRYLLRKYPRVERPELEPITPEVADAARRYLKAASIEKKASAAKELAGNQLRDLIGDCAGMFGAGLKVRWRQTKSGRSLDVREVKER